MTEIKESLARIETKLDAHKESLDKHESKIYILEKKVWTSVGSLVLALGAWIKSLV